MRPWISLAVLVLGFCASARVFAGDRNSLHLEGEILLSDSTPVVASSVQFTVKIFDDSQSCVLWSEQQMLNMSSSAGLFSLDLGSATNRLTGVSNFADVFSNRLTYAPTSDCGSGYNGNGTNRDRYLQVTFDDGNGPVTLSSQVIKSSAYAMDAARIGGYQASDFLLLTGIPTCGAGTFLTWNGSMLTCLTPAGGGTVNSITSGNGFITVSGTTASPTLTLNVGTAAGTVAAGDDSRFANISNASLLTGTLPTSVLPGFSGDVSSSAGSSVLNLTNIGTSGTYAKVTVDAKGRVTSGGALGSTDITSALGFTPINPVNMPANCSAGQTLTFTSPSGTWLCSTIQVSASSFANQTQNTVLAAPTNAFGPVSFRSLAIEDLPTTGANFVFKNNGNSTTGAATFGTLGSNNLNFMTSSTVQATLDPNGRLGLGISPETVLDVNGSVTFRKAYYEKVYDLGNITSCPSPVSLTDFNANIFTLGLCPSGITTVDIPFINGWPGGVSAWNVTFYATGNASGTSIFNVAYSASTTNVFWDKYSTNGIGGNSYAGFPVDANVTNVIHCTVLKTSPVKVYCGVGAQY